MRGPGKLQGEACVDLDLKEKPQLALNHGITVVLSHCFPVFYRSFFESFIRQVLIELPALCQVLFWVLRIRRKVSHT